MIENKFNTVKEEKKKSRLSSTSKGVAFNIGGVASQLLTGKVFDKYGFYKSFPFLLFVFSLLILYISNGYYVEKTVKKLQKVSKEIDDLRSEYITIKSELNIKSQQSQIAIKAESIGLEEARKPPIKIYLNKKEYKAIKED